MIIPLSELNQLTNLDKALDEMTESSVSESSKGRRAATTAASACDLQHKLILQLINAVKCCLIEIYLNRVRIR